VIQKLMMMMMMMTSTELILSKVKRSLFPVASVETVHTLCIFVSLTATNS